MAKNTRFQFRVKEETLKEYNMLVDETNFSSEGLLLEMMQNYKENVLKIDLKRSEN